MNIVAAIGAVGKSKDEYTIMPSTMDHSPSISMIVPLAPKRTNADPHITAVIPECVYSRFMSALL